MCSIPHLLRDKSAITAEECSSGTTISKDMTGSKMFVPD